MSNQAPLLPLIANESTGLAGQASAGLAALRDWLTGPPLNLRNQTLTTLIGLFVAIFGLPYALPIAVLTFFGGFIPIVGATIAGGIHKPTRCHHTRGITAARQMLVVGTSQ